MFKLGDKVRTKCGGLPRHGRPFIVEPREQFVGREGTVTDIHNEDPAEDGYYGVDFDNGHDAISGVNLELVDAAPPIAVATPIPSDNAPTLRDQFAMAALTGFLATVREAPSDWNEDNVAAEVAGVAYDLADAMMDARQG